MEALQCIGDVARNIMSIVSVDENRNTVEFFFLLMNGTDASHDRRNTGREIFGKFPGKCNVHHDIARPRYHEHIGSRNEPYRLSMRNTYVQGRYLVQSARFQVF